VAPVAANLFDITLAGGTVASIVPSTQQREARGTLLSALVDAHAHIDKNYTVRTSARRRATCLPPSTA
jgi:cytosine deaminase